MSGHEHLADTTQVPHEVIHRLSTRNGAVLIPAPTLLTPDFFNGPCASLWTTSPRMPYPDPSRLVCLCPLPSIPSLGTSAPTGGPGPPRTRRALEGRHSVQVAQLLRFSPMPNPAPSSPAPGFSRRFGGELSAGSARAVIGLGAGARRARRSSRARALTSFSSRTRSTARASRGRVFRRRAGCTCATSCR